MATATKTKRTVTVVTLVMSEEEAHNLAEIMGNNVRIPHLMAKSGYSEEKVQDVMSAIFQALYGAGVLRDNHTLGGS